LAKRLNGSDVLPALFAVYIAFQAKETQWPDFKVGLKVDRFKLREETTRATTRGNSSLDFRARSRAIESPSARDASKEQISILRKAEEIRSGMAEWQSC
jgi:hypothetical protein